VKRDTDKFISVDAGARTVLLRSPRSPITYDSASITLLIPSYETPEGARRSANHVLETWHRASVAATLDAVRDALAETPTFTLTDEARSAVRELLSRIDAMRILRNDLS